MDFLAGNIESPVDRLLGTVQTDNLNLVSPDAALSGLINQLQASPFVDQIQGLNGNDIIVDTDLSRILEGNIGNDTIYGNGGNDLIRGGKNNDFLLGGDGDDIVSGDFGSDTLTGGSGVDRFDFGDPTSTDVEVDLVTDFTDGQDKIGLKNGLVFDSLNIEQVAQDTRISVKGGTFGDISMVLQNVNASSLTQEDFVPVDFTRPDLLFVQDAASGSYNSVTGKLTLQGVDNNTLAFSDRPYRIAYDMNTDKFSEFFASSDLAQDPPNAVLDFGGDRITLELLTPAYDAANQSLTYDTRILEGSIPASFGQSALFIDSWSGFLSGILSGAAAGAELGTTFPGIGNLVGAIGGGIIGGIAGALE